MKFTFTFVAALFSLSAKAAVTCTLDEIKAIHFANVAVDEAFRSTPQIQLTSGMTEVIDGTGPSQIGILVFGGISGDEGYFKIELKDDVPTGKVDTQPFKSMGNYQRWLFFGENKIHPMFYNSNLMMNLFSAKTCKQATDAVLDFTKIGMKLHEELLKIAPLEGEFADYDSEVLNEMCAAAGHPILSGKISRESRGSGGDRRKKSNIINANIPALKYIDSETFFAWVGGAVKQYMQNHPNVKNALDITVHPGHVKPTEEELAQANTLILNSCSEIARAEKDLMNKVLRADRAVHQAQYPNKKLKKLKQF